MRADKLQNDHARCRDAGSVQTSFIVSKNGEVLGLEVLHGIGSGCDEEAMRVIGLLDGWTQAMKDGEPVDALIELPINYRLE